MRETRVKNEGIRYVNKVLKHMRYNTFFSEKCCVI